jgi:hypothetical protein
MPWNNEHMLTDADGNLIPQVWDPSQNKFVPYEAKVQLSGTLTELEQARELLEAISGKDFATQTTLAAVLAKLADLESELATIKANQLSGDQKVQLSGNDVVIGLLADRPPASEMRGRGYYAWDETDGHKLKYSDGTNWVVNQ